MISGAWIIRPLVWSIEFLYELFGQKSFHVTKEDDVIFAMEVDPAAVAVLGILALRLARLGGVEYLVESLMVNISEHDIKILTKWYISIAVNDETAHDALAAQSQVAITPLVIKGHKVVVLLSVVDAFGNLPHKV